MRQIHDFTAFTQHYELGDNSSRGYFDYKWQLKGQYKNMFLHHSQRKSRNGDSRDSSSLSIGQMKMVEQLSTPNKKRKFHPSFSDKEKMQKTFYAHVVETPKLNFMKILETEPD